MVGKDRDIVKQGQLIFSLHLVLLISECFMYWSIELTFFLLFCVGVKFGVLHKGKDRD
jgi:hypothetical protein